MLPLSDGNRLWIDTLETPPVRSVLPGFQDLTPAVEAFASSWSQHGRLAYVQAEFWGGTGWQASVGWEHGVVSLGPVFTADHEDERLTEAYRIVPLREGAINRALRFLGIESDDIDEFASVGLGRHRWTADW